MISPLTVCKLGIGKALPDIPATTLETCGREGQHPISPRISRENDSKSRWLTKPYAHPRCLCKSEQTGLECTNVDHLVTMLGVSI